MAFAFVALFSKCVKMQGTLFDEGLKRTNTITTVDNSPECGDKSSVAYVVNTQKYSKSSTASRTKAAS